MDNTIQDNAPETVRYLNATIATPKELATVDSPDGVTIPDFPLLATGVWTDSAVRTPLNYPKATLEAYATNWADRGVWVRHQGATPRSINEKIGEVRNLRYEPNTAGGAVVGDILFYNDTQASKDALTQVRTGRINAISVEHGWTEKYNSQTNQMDATSLVFYGAALADKGACRTCVLKRNEEPANGENMPENSEQLKALEAKNAELEKALAAAPKADELKALNEKVAQSAKALEDAKAAHAKELADLKASNEKALADMKAAYEEKVKKLENEPKNPKTLAQPEKQEAKAPVYSGPKIRREGKNMIIEG